MRIPILISLSIASASLVACANVGNADEYAELRAECEARGGIFVPSGESTGRPVLDNVCEIHDASLLN